MEGGRRAGGASDGDKKEGARRGASFHADQHEQPCLYIKERGQDAEAIKLMEKCLQLRTLLLGADHPDTLSSSAALKWWQTSRLEIDVSAAKILGNNNMS